MDKVIRYKGAWDPTSLWLVFLSTQGLGLLGARCCDWRKTNNIEHSYVYYLLAHFSLQRILSISYLALHWIRLTRLYSWMSTHNRLFYPYISTYIFSVRYVLGEPSLGPRVLRWVPEHPLGTQYPNREPSYTFQELRGSLDSRAGVLPPHVNTSCLFGCRGYF